MKIRWPLRKPANTHLVQKVGKLGIYLPSGHNISPANHPHSYPFTQENATFQEALTMRLCYACADLGRVHSVIWASEEKELVTGNVVYPHRATPSRRLQLSQHGNSIASNSAHNGRPPGKSHGLVAEQNGCRIVNRHQFKEANTWN